MGMQFLFSERQILNSIKNMALNVLILHNLSLNFGVLNLSRMPKTQGSQIVHGQQNALIKMA